MIQNFLIGASNLPRGVDLLTLPDFSLFFLVFLKILYENEIILSQSGVQVNPRNPLWIPHLNFDFLIWYNVVKYLRVNLVKNKAVYMLRYDDCSKISNTFLFLLVIRAGTRKLFVRIANREDPDLTAASEAV